MTENNELYRDEPSPFDNEPDTGSKHYPAAVLCRWCKEKLFVLADETECYKLCFDCHTIMEKLREYHQRINSERSSSQTS